VITAAALVPHPPLLLRELGGAHDPVPDLRAAALAAVRDLVADADTVAVVGGADVSRGWDPGAGADVRRFGTTAARPSRGALPLSLGVGVRLLGDAGWTGPVVADSLAWDERRPVIESLAGRLADRRDRTAVLVLGDGGARRGERAPGYLDERAFPFDEAVAKALADGEAGALVDLDTDLAAELMVLGRAAFRFLGVLAQTQPARPDASLAFRDDPFGVDYLVATWRFRPGRGTGA
jgi:hypothetical protein